MVKLPQRLTLDQLQTRWASIIDPVVTQPDATPVFLQNVNLVSGANSINHRLGYPLQGWQITRIRAAATIYDTQDTNQMPQLTLNLVASAPVVVDIKCW